ncbi:DMT family transporter [Winslowiella iniecta]|uniref:Quaternary ammonium transporter n=1 Tax=Winslowiella iniecta TaxID=1560201 RepID=A0A0L7T883_9GAMM|nr:multidrug efflux SMR transporter [Winslowiella iniecta]KOC91583.1 quaternary ammonium transporter [Winslowiella iniecta]KOC94465.1 quaternary ammonium transporter [Winslowiella iniecta]
MNLFLAWMGLAGAIVMEVAGTVFLGKSEQFTRLYPSLMTVMLYGLSFYLLSQVLRTLPLAVAYASWGGLGIVLTAAMGVVVFKQRLDLPAIVGIALIVTGVVVVNGFSKMVSH